MFADYVIRGDRENFQKDWDEKMARETYKENVEATDEIYIQDLYEDYDGRIADFTAEFGWTPPRQGAK